MVLVAGRMGLLSAGCFGGESGGEAVATTCWGMLRHLGLVLGGSPRLLVPGRGGGMRREGAQGRAICSCTLGLGVLRAFPVQKSRTWSLSAVPVAPAAGWDASPRLPGTWPGRMWGTAATSGSPRPLDDARGDARRGLTQLLNSRV